MKAQYIANISRFTWRYIRTDQDPAILDALVKGGDSVVNFESIPINVQEPSRPVRPSGTERGRRRRD